MARAGEKPRQDPLEKEALDRLQECREQKAHIQSDLTEAYVFAAPHRARSISSTSKPGSAKPGSESEVDTNFFMEMCGDFPTEIENTFMPQTGGWAQRKAGPAVPKDKVQKVEDLAAEGDKTIFSMIGASNFYEEFGKGANPDLSIGVFAMWIDHRHPWEPIHCQSVPIRELEFKLGPDGRIDDRFVVRHTKNRYVKAILPGVKLPADLLKEIDEKPEGEAVVARGFWRLWDREAEEGGERWQYVALVNEKKVHDVVCKGRGSIALVIGRFGADCDYAWPRGPLLKTLADGRVIDELAYKKVEAIDFHIQPPVAWPGDLPDDDIEAGRLYSLPLGHAESIKNIYEPPALDPAIYFASETEQRVKRLFYLDNPTQPGKTPPTATQWLDEMTMKQQRIGQPGYAFWTEACGGTFVRFQYLGEKAGWILPVEIDGKAITLLPYNPAQKSIEQQEVAMFARFVQIAGEAFPEEFKLGTDGTKSMAKLARKMAVLGIWVPRDPDDIKQALAHLQALAQNGTPGAPDVPQPQVPQQDTGQSMPPPRLSLAT
jgi:hypothetical protein